MHALCVEIQRRSDLSGFGCGVFAAADRLGRDGGRLESLDRPIDARADDSGNHAQCDPVYARHDGCYAGSSGNTNAFNAARDDE